MSVHLHDYAAEDIAGLYDGAVLMHGEAARLLARNMDCRFHDIRNGAASIQSVAHDDVVYAGCGPYAALYHLWRHRTGKCFRIVREVHTAFWSGYWTQEELCAPYVREGDLVLFPTEYARQLFCRHFPATTLENSAVAYPIPLDGKPPGEQRKTADLRIGYIGALSDAKGFDQVLEIFAAYYGRSGGQASFHFAGKPNHENYAHPSVCQWLRNHGVPIQRIRSYGEIPPGQISTFFAECDLVLFPSLASRETLGRVVLEALWHGLPVLAAELGPAAELLPAANLIPANLRYGQRFNMARVVALGRVDVEAAVEILIERNFTPGARFERNCYSPELFLDLLNCPAGRPPQTELWDRRTPNEVTVTPRRESDTEWALEQFEELFQRGFSQKPRGSASEYGGSPREPAIEIIDRGGLRLSDMRAFPRVIDAELWPPLDYHFDCRASGVNAGL